MMSHFAPAEVLIVEHVRDHTNTKVIIWRTTDMAMITETVENCTGRWRETSTSIVHKIGEPSAHWAFQSAGEILKHLTA